MEEVAAGTPRLQRCLHRRRRDREIVEAQRGLIGLQLSRHHVRAVVRGSPSASEPPKRQAATRRRATAAEPSPSPRATAPTVASRVAESRNEAAGNSRPTRHPVSLWKRASPDRRRDRSFRHRRGFPEVYGSPPLVAAAAQQAQGPLGSCTSAVTTLGRLPLLPGRRLLRRGLLRRLLAGDRHKHFFLAG